MKKQATQTVGVITPAMEVWTKDWRFLGTVPDTGTEGSLAEGRRVFGAEAYFVLPTLVEAA